MSRPSIQAACERIADRLLYTSAQVEMLMPPQNVLSDEQQVSLYLAIVSNPMAVATLKLVKGSDTYARWEEDMQRKAKLLGAASVRVAQLQADVQDEIMQIAQQTAAPEGSDVELGPRDY